MDEALILKQQFYQGKIQTAKQALPFLQTSKLVKQLLEGIDLEVLHLLHRLLAFSEIPFSDQLEKVQVWRDQLAELSFCEEGFSLNGQKDGLLACYNGMITHVLIRLNYPNQRQIQSGIDWILNYQNVVRNQVNNWSGSSIEKYGGCMKSTPCFIGIVKSMIALSSFKKKNKSLAQKRLNEKLDAGLAYILEHQVFLRKSNSNPITKDITKLTYPFTYKTNIVELLRLLKENDLLQDPRTEQAIAFLLKKRKKDGFWRVNSFYKPKFWVDFDQPKEPASWLSFEIQAFLPQSDIER